MAAARIEAVRNAREITSSPSPAIALTVLSALALLCLAAYWVIGAAAVAVPSARLIHNASDNSYPESANVYEAIQAARAGRLYLSVFDPPYVLQPYGPLYYAINALIAKTAHLNVDLMEIRARTLTFSCFLLSGFIAFLIAKSLKFSFVESLCAPAMLVAQRPFLQWDVTVRPDMLLLLVMLLSLLLAVNLTSSKNSPSDNSRHALGYVLAGVFGGMAFLIKQPGLAAPLAIGVVLVFRRHYRQAAALAVGAAATVLLAVVALLSRHEPFFAQFTLLSKSPWSFANGIAFTIHNAAFVSLLVPLAIGALGFAVAIRGEEAAQMVACFAAANWLLGFVAIPQLGGDYNYYLPGLAGCALLLPFVIRAFRQNVRSAAIYAGVIVVLLIFLPGEIENASAAIRRSNSAGPAMEESVFAGLHDLRILSDRPAFAFHGRDPDLLDPFSTHALELAGSWNSSPIVENVRRGKYDLVMLTCNSIFRTICSWRGVSFFSPAVVSALNENYVVLCSTPRATILKPRDRDIVVTPATLQTVLGAPCGTARRGFPPSLTLEQGAR